MSETDLTRLIPVYGQSEDLRSEVKKLINNNQAIKEWAYQKVKADKKESLKTSIYT